MPNVLMGIVVTLVTPLYSSPPRSATLLLVVSHSRALICIFLMLVRKFREEEMREQVRIRCVG